MKIIKITLAFVVFPFLLIAQQSMGTTPSISPEMLREDLQILKRNLEAVHPGLYTYHSKEELDAAFQQVAAALDQPMSPIAFCDRVTPLLKLIANGHTDIYPARSYFAQWNEYLFFPFEVYWYKEELYLMKNLSSEEAIANGVVIEQINGEKASEVFEELTNQVTRDGYNTSLPEAKVSGGFYRWYASFKGNPEKFDLVLKDANGQRKDWSVDALTSEVIERHKQERYSEQGAGPADHKDLLDLEIKGKVATLTVSTFEKKYAKKRGQKFKPFFNDAFAKIKASGAQHLIIDLRNNGGGDPMPTIELLSHLTNEPFTLYRNVTALTRKVPEKQYYLDKVGKLHFLTSLAFKKEGDHFKVKGLAAKMKGLDGLKPVKPAKDVFDGQLYVLTNPYSFSATGEFSAMLKERDRGIFIGEEAGGNPNQNASGIMLTLELPHTRNRVAIPMILFEVNVDFENTGHGVMPDYVVEHAPSEIIRKKDAAMDFTIQLIEKKNVVPTAAH